MFLCICIALQRRGVKCQPVLMGTPPVQMLAKQNVCSGVTKPPKVFPVFQHQSAQLKPVVN